MQATTPKIVGPKDGKAGFLGSIGVRFMIDGAESGGGFSLVEHPMPRARSPRRSTGTTARTSTATCSRGAWARCSATTCVEAGPATSSTSRATSGTRSGTPATSPARILEIISPAGFERFFDELVELGGAVNADPQALAELSARYELEMDPDSIPGLLERFDLRMGEPS